MIESEDRAEDFRVMHSVHAAADALSVTSGAVSHQLRLLEEHFGTSLFQRQGRGLLLTHAGNAYYQQIREHVEGLRLAGQVLHRSAGKSVIRLHSFTTFATRWLIPRLTAFQLANPEIDIRLTTASDWDDSTHYDAAIRPDYGDWPQMHAAPLVANILLPVCRPTPERKATLNVQNLPKQTLLRVRGRPDDWRLWAEAWHLNPDDFPFWRDLESSALACQAAIEGQGVALAQRVLVEKSLMRGR